MADPNWWEEKDGAPEPKSGGLSEKEVESNTSEAASNVPFFSGYTKQKAAATGLFAFSFLVGDWWGEGTNGFSALIESSLAVLEMPTWIPEAIEGMTSALGFAGILIVISLVLWQITPLVFFCGFALSWRGYYGAEVDPEELEQRRRRGKSSYRFLFSFSILLLVMDFIQYMVWMDWNLLEIPQYPLDFFSFHFWQMIAFGAVFGLNPENEWIN